MSPLYKTELSRTIALDSGIDPGAWSPGQSVPSSKIRPQFLLVNSRVRTSPCSDGESRISGIREPVNGFVGVRLACRYCFGRERPFDAVAPFGFGCVEGLIRLTQQPDCSKPAEPSAQATPMLQVTGTLDSGASKRSLPIDCRKRSATARLPLKSQSGITTRTSSPP